MAIKQTFYCEVCAALVEGGGVFIGGTNIQPQVVPAKHLAKVHICPRCVHMIADAADSESMQVPG
jgi:hypothetical protein